MYHHDRSCSKLTTTDGLIEFDSPEKAKASGGISCKHCNQSAVDNITESTVQPNKKKYTNAYGVRLNQGTSTLPDGSKYIGEHKDDKKRVVADNPENVEVEKAEEENVEELRKAEQKVRMAEWEAKRDSKRAEWEAKRDSKRAEWAAKREAGKAEKKKDKKKDKDSSDDGSSIPLHDPQEENTNARIPVIGTENKMGVYHQKCGNHKKIEYFLYRPI